MKLRHGLVVALLVLAAPVALAQNDGAGPLGAWLYWSWSTLGETVDVGTVDFSSENYLDVTDCFIDGDQFEVFIDDVSVGVTSVPADDGDWTGDPDFAFASPKWSSGTFGPYTTTHNVKFKTIATATGYAGGGAYYRTNPVPEPTSLLCLALGGLALLRRR